MARVEDAPAEAGTGEGAGGLPFVRVPHSLFASAGDEPRRRRVDDVVVLAFAAATVLVAALLADETGDAGEAAAGSLDGLLGWLDPLWAAAYVASTLLVVVILVAALAGRRYALLRDALLGGGLCLGIGALVTSAVDGRWPAWSGVLWSAGPPTYPSLRLAVVTAIALVALPDLTRPIRYAALVVVGLSTVAATVLGDAYPIHVLGGLALGVGVGAAVRLAFGSSAGFPTSAGSWPTWPRSASTRSTSGATTTSAAASPATGPSGGGTRAGRWPCTAGTPGTRRCWPGCGGCCGTGTPGRRRRSPAGPRSSTRG